MGVEKLRGRQLSPPCAPNTGCIIRESLKWKIEETPKGVCTRKKRGQGNYYANYVTTTLQNIQRSGWMSVFARVSA